MTEILRYEGRQRVRGSILVTVGFVLVAGLYVGLFPSVEQSGVDFEQFLESAPEAAQSAFAVGNLNTIEGFLAVELYQFVWILLLGVYVAYSGGGLIAAGIEQGRIDMLLATPISRRRIVLEKYLSLLVPIVVANLFVPIAVAIGVGAIGETISLVDLYAVHLLSIPYLLCCGGIGLALSVAVDRPSLAQRGGLLAVFGLFLVETIASSAGVDWLGGLSPTRYYDPAEILVDGTYDVAGALILLSGAVALLVLASAYFEARDVS